MRHQLHSIQHSVLCTRLSTRCSPLAVLPTPYFPLPASYSLTPPTLAHVSPFYTFPLRIITLVCRQRPRAASCRHGTPLGPRRRRPLLSRPDRGHRAVEPSQQTRGTGQEPRDPPLEGRKPSPRPGVSARCLRADDAEARGDLRSCTDAYGRDSGRRTCAFGREPSRAAAASAPPAPPDCTDAATKPSARQPFRGCSRHGLPGQPAQAGLAASGRPQGGVRPRFMVGGPDRRPAGGSLGRLPCHLAQPALDPPALVAPGRNPLARASPGGSADGWSRRAGISAACCSRSA